MPGFVFDLMKKKELAVGVNIDEDNFLVLIIE